MHAGGGYQQALNAANLVKRLSRDVVEPYFVTSEEDNIAVLKELGIDAVCIPLGAWQKVFMAFRRRLFSANTRGLLLWKKVVPYNSFERGLVLLGIDLMYFISPTGRARSLEVTNYMTTLWDLCHRDDLEFPEVRENRIFEGREKHYRSILPKAVAVFVDSPLGKLNAVRRYGVDEERIHVLPFSPAPAVQDASGREVAVSVNIREKYSLAVPYVYYPAQFWSHKNHVYLLEGLRVLEDEYGIKVGAIFSGGDQGNLSYVKSVVERLGLEDRVRFAGFVDNDEVPILYQQSVALVMPTYFGPTNLPPLEAFSLGVPVLYPDKAGLRDQVGDGALLMDLGDPRSMARHLKELVSRPELREEMARRGKDRLKAFSDEERVQVLEGVLRDFQRRMVCWSA
ncbi:glycosyltransferase family 1 protein [Chlorobium phaeovibrioides]|nr:glycosyltransferase family 1 protein [Chlorobium phaeovibrioides]